MMMNQSGMGISLYISSSPLALRVHAPFPTETEDSASLMEPKHQSCLDGPEQSRAGEEPYPRAAS